MAKFKIEISIRLIGILGREGVQKAKAKAKIKYWREFFFVLFFSLLNKYSKLENTYSFFLFTKSKILLLCQLFSRALCSISSRQQYKKNLEIFIFVGICHYLSNRDWNYNFAIFILHFSTDVNTEKINKINIKKKIRLYIRLFKNEKNNKKQKLSAERKQCSTTSVTFHTLSYICQWQ